MSCSRSCNRGLFRRVCLPLPLLLGLSGAARGQPRTDRSFDVQLFRAPVGPNGFLTLDSAHVPSHKQFGVSLVSTYQRGAFSIDVESRDRPEDAAKFDVVRDQFSSELAGAIGLLDRFEVGLAVPLTLGLSGTDYSSVGQPGESLSASGFGDLRLEGKASIAAFGPAEEFLLALAPGITIPTGDGSKFLGDKTVTGRLRAITEYRLDKVRAAGMVGFQGRGSSQAFEAKLGSQFLYTLALEYRVHRQASVLAEWFGRVGSATFVDPNPSEVDLGMRVGLPHMLSVGFGGGLGLNRGIGAPQFRGFLALQWAPDFRDRDRDAVYDVDDRCPDDVEDRDGYKDSDGCPDPDNDGDGLPDVQDKCPGVAEDLDQFQDDDGCPEEDNDKDGVPDIKDACPNAAEDKRGKRTDDGCPSSAEDQDGDGIADARDKCADEPEDRDGFEDYDGCPDLDNDNDGIPDQFDGCPGEAEDPDGFEDADGCADPDNDKDGFTDAKDKCPAQAETLNGSRDDDGCPDSGAEIVRLGTDRIEVRERIRFAGTGDKLSASGLAIVNLVAMILRGNRELEKVRIEVSIERGSKEAAQARADAVSAALVAAGVQAHRLRAVGAAGGGDKVDFVIESRAAKKKPTGGAP